MVKSFFIRIACMIVAGVMLLFTGANTGADYDVAKPDEAKLNFSILSDSHIEGNNFNRFKVFARSIQDIKKNKSGNDAIIFLGDNVMNGQVIESLLFNGAASTVLKGEKILPCVGNHDIGNGEGDYAKLQQRWYDFTAATFGRELNKPYYYEVIDGYYFIVLSMEEQLVYEMTMSREQLDWLKGVLAEAENSGKPVFVFAHYPSDDAINPDGSECTELVDMLAEYNETHDLFYFCGHTHMPLMLYWSFHTSNGYPEIYLPRLTELYGDDDEIGSDSGIGVEVEIYENEVLVRGRNFCASHWYIDPVDEVPCQKTYELKNPIK